MSTVARQPILDTKLETYAYELLFRSGVENAFTGLDGNQASSSVISDSFCSIGLQLLTGGRPAFINFTRDLLLDEVPSLLDRSQVVVEILEDVAADPDVLAACRRLKEMGYRLAMDDFQYRPDLDPLIEMTDIIKVDFTLSPPAERRSLAKRFLPEGKALLAEKVETHEEFDEASRLGYRYFQGYFFSRPVIMRKRAIPESKLIKLRLLQLIQDPDLDVREAAELLKRDVSLTVKLLRYINSAAFGLRHPVNSIEHAIAMLGMRNFAKWVSLVTLANMVDEKPPELLMQASARARFCESLAPTLGLKGRASDLFLLGMFSFLDAILDQPMEEAIEDIPLAEDLKEALRGEANTLGAALNAAVCYERADWSACEIYETRFGLGPEEAARLYHEAQGWAQQLLAETTGAETAPAADRSRDA